ncbi:MAG TPA: hypothetical protein VFX53_04610 [Pedococcus sp.]|nr:hypothetical protein [Pedococcus sp.]
MGLDIYLVPQADKVANDAYEAAHSALYERPDYDTMSKEERDAARAALPPYVPHQSVPSANYAGPHLFNRRYLRSSYNGAGFNRAVPMMTNTGHDLYWIFEPVRGCSEEYDFELTGASIPALYEARERAQVVAQEIRDCDQLLVDSCTPTFPRSKEKLPSEDEVLAWFCAERVKHDANADEFSHESYHTAGGLVLGLTTGTEVLAITLGMNALEWPVAMFVYRPDPDAVQTYVESAMITAEFCDEAIMLIQRDGSVFMEWSG